jgi:AraC-like DNA-binding protein
VKTEVVFPPPARWRQREQLANLEEYAREVEASLGESLDHEDLVHALPQLAIPALADFAIVEVVEGDRCVRSTFAHCDPGSTAAVRTLIAHRAELRHFAEGRRALDGEPVLFRFSGSTLRQRSMHAPEMSELIRLLQPTSAIFVPFAVLGQTIAVAGFMRTLGSGLHHGPRELALAAEVSRRALIRQAGLTERPIAVSLDARLRRADDFLRARLASPLSLAELAREAGLSRFHMLRLFKQAYGETPFKRLARLRMEDAQRRLARTQDSVTEIAFAVGYENPAHFASAFRRFFGVSPSRFRRLVQ